MIKFSVLLHGVMFENKYLWLSIYVWLLWGTAVWTRGGGGVGQ